MSRYRKCLAIASVFCILLSSVVALGANTTIDTHFSVQTTPSFRIPLCAAYPKVVTTEAGSSVDPATICVYEADIPITGKFTFADSDNPSMSYHWITGSAAFNVTLNVTEGKTGEDDISFVPVVTDNLVTAYNGYTVGQNSNVCRTLAYFASYPTYGQPYVNLGTFHFKHVTMIDVNLEPEAYITVTPTVTKITAGMVYPENPDNIFGMAQVIREAIEESDQINDIISVLRTIYNADSVFFANILTQMGIVEGNQQSIITLLNAIKSQDLAFYTDVREYLTAKQEEASEAVQEASEAQQEASEIAHEIEQTEPDIDGALDVLEGQLHSGPTSDLFYYLDEGGIILTLCIFAFALTTISFIMFGKR